MLSFVLALAFAMQNDAINASRQAYSTCLRDYMRAQLAADAQPAAFEAALPNQCTDRATAFRQALVNRDVSAGGARARARAEEDAQMALEDIRATALERFRDEHSAAHPEPAAPQAAATPAPAEAPPSTPQ
jgi:hypothetical protein